MIGLPMQLLHDHNRCSHSQPPRIQTFQQEHQPHQNRTQDPDFTFGCSHPCSKHQASNVFNNCPWLLLPLLLRFFDRCCCCCSPRSNADRSMEQPEPITTITQHLRRVFVVGVFPRYQLHTGGLLPCTTALFFVSLFSLSWQSFVVSNNE